MPHQCTGCGHVFPDGSKQMLSGCPECNGNKFQFLPKGEAQEQSSDPDQQGHDIIEAPAEEARSREDRAQASARSTVVSADELPPMRQSPAPEPTAGDEPSEPERLEPTDLAALREELNDQFESIKILKPGEYELNLMELYDRDEYIIALEEDGRYAIDVPSSWRADREPDPSQ